MSPDGQKTEAEYDADIAEIAAAWADQSQTLIDAGWTPPFAFASIADRVAKIDSSDEATIQMMTGAAGLVFSLSGWEHRDAFASWWNDRFADAPRLGDGRFAAPCLMEVGDKRAAIIATWSCFTRQYARERAQA